MLTLAWTHSVITQMSYCWPCCIAAITMRSCLKTGNKRVRRLLVETSWHYRHPYSVSRILRQRRKDQPQWVIDIADRAGQRLRKRYWYLVNKGKMPCKATVAIARELTGFIWSVFREYEVRNGKEAAWKIIDFFITQPPKPDFLIFYNLIKVRYWWVRAR